MGKKVLYYCDNCKTEVTEIPSNWLTNIPTGQTKAEEVDYADNTLTACSLDCLMGLCSNPESGINLHEVKLNYFFIQQAIIDYDQAKIFPQLPSIIKIKPTKGIGKGKGNRGPNYTDDQKKLIFAQPTVKAAITAFKKQYPDLDRSDFSIQKLWHKRRQPIKEKKKLGRKSNIEKGTQTKYNPKDTFSITGDKKVETIVGVSSAMVSLDLPKPNLTDYGKSKELMYFTSTRQPWLEQLMCNNFKSSSCMDKMKAVWDIDRDNAQSGIITNTFPDGAYLYYNGFYKLWINPINEAALTQHILRDGDIQNLTEITD